MQVWNEKGTMTEEASKLAWEAGQKIKEILIDLESKGIPLRDAEMILSHEVFIAVTVLLTSRKTNGS